MNQKVNKVLSNAVIDERMKRAPGTNCGLKDIKVFTPHFLQDMHTHVNNCTLSELLSQGIEEEKVRLQHLLS